MRLGMLGYPITCLGPGKRVGVWTMGCDRGCPGCVSPKFQSFDDAHQVSVEELVRRIEAKAPRCKKATISGGEPFLQPDLLQLLRALREKGYDDILVYTGNRYEDLAADESCSACLRYIDVLIDGPYIESLNDDLPLRGSSNQRVIFLNPDREKEYAPCLSGARRYQLEVVEQGRVNFYGIPPLGLDPHKLDEII